MRSSLSTLLIVSTSILLAGCVGPGLSETSDEDVWVVQPLALSCHGSELTVGRFAVATGYVTEISTFKISAMPKSMEELGVCEVGTEFTAAPNSAAYVRSTFSDDLTEIVDPQLPAAPCPESVWMVSGQQILTIEGERLSTASSACGDSETLAVSEARPITSAVASTQQQSVVYTVDAGGRTAIYEVALDRSREPRLIREVEQSVVFIGWE
jgi:hypothetical protein